MSVPKSKRKPSTYDIADLAQRITESVYSMYNKVFKFSPIMAHDCLGRVVEESQRLLDNVTRYLEGFSGPWYKKFYVETSIDAANGLEVLIEDFMRHENSLIYICSDGKMRGVTKNELIQLSEYIERFMDAIQRVEVYP